MYRHFVIAAAVAIASPVFAAAPVTGKWTTAERDSIIEIGNCGGTVCGRVAKVLKAMPNGKTPIDANNPDPKLRGRPVEGLMILTGFADNGSNWLGKIYDPKSGKTYTSYLTRNADGTLKVQGCYGPFCKTITWTAVR
jgi:uncharacterized protein (DUF2147 family)